MDRDPPINAPENESGWSIEDFDDFAGFDEGDDERGSDESQLDLRLDDPAPQSGEAGHSPGGDDVADAPDGGGTGDGGAASESDVRDADVGDSPSQEDAADESDTDPRDVEPPSAAESDPDPRDAEPPSADLQGADAEEVQHGGESSLPAPGADADEVQHGGESSLPAPGAGGDEVQHGAETPSPAPDEDQGDAAADVLEVAPPVTPLGFDAPDEIETYMDRPVPAAGADATGAAVPDEDAAAEAEEVRDFSDFTDEHYVQATTQEYAGLAEDVARADTDATEQIAVSASIPGLETGVVGLEDVVTDDDEETIAPTRSGGDLSVRVLTALALISIFFGSLYQDYLIAILIFVVMMVAAVEMYIVLLRNDHRPMTLLGMLGIAGSLFGTWYWGPQAMPVAIVLTVIATLAFFGVVAHRREPLLDATLTLLVVAWIAGLGSLAMDIAWAPDYAWMVAAVVVITALMDVAQYFVGRRLGKRQLAPKVSPKKTIEGLVGGIVAALGVGAMFGTLPGPFELVDGLVLGAIVAVTAPMGDLAVSVVKRALGVKDMGAILPGHGGVLDRIDGMIFVIPAAWIAYSWMGLIA